MTERKPPGMSFTSWIDQQISEAAARGAFDDLPGAGKPLPKRPDSDDGQSWARDYALREGVPVEELLPPPLKLRKESARLAETVHRLRSEEDVREAVAGLNERIMRWRRLPVGPPVFVPLVDADAMVRRWREGQPAAASASPPAAASSPAEASQATDAAAGADSAQRRWWQRRSRIGRSRG
jgi:hypothetical protein